MAPSREDFARWREDPVTRWVLQAHAEMAEQCRLQWLGISWDNGQANPGALSELRTRADTYLAITQTPYDGYCEALGEEPCED